ncbi:MAG: dTDP-4-dehydrorhamnose reductase [bacterium]
MRVLILGSRGQLGADLVRAFADCPVTPCTSEDLDITDESLVQQRIAYTAPDLVINAAAYTRVDDCEREPLRAFQVNALGPRHLALACQRWDVPLVHISTNYVFDGAKTEFYAEDDPARPLNTYGITKLAGEHYVQALWEKHYIIRVAGLFGLTPSRLKGTNFIEAMLRLGAKGTPLRIVCDESLSPTYTADAAAVIRRLVESGRYGVYHLANQGGCTWLEFAREIFAQAGMNVSLTPVTAHEYGAPARRPANSCLHTRKLDALGLGPLRSWQEALRDYLAKKTTDSRNRNAPSL